MRDVNDKHAHSYKFTADYYAMVYEQQRREKQQKCTHPEEAQEIICLDCMKHLKISQSKVVRYGSGRI